MDKKAYRLLKTIETVICIASCIVILFSFLFEKKTLDTNESLFLKLFLKFGISFIIFNIINNYIDIGVIKISKIILNILCMKFFSDLLKQLAILFFVKSVSSHFINQIIYYFKVETNNINILIITFFVFSVSYFPLYLYILNKEKKLFSGIMQKK